MHELLADDVLTDAGGRHQVVELVEELHAALMVLRRSFTQLVPQDQSHTLGKKDWKLELQQLVDQLISLSKENKSPTILMID